MVVSRMETVGGSHYLPDIEPALNQAFELPIQATLRKDWKFSASIFTIFNNVIELFIKIIPWNSIGGEIGNICWYGMSTKVQTVTYTTSFQNS